MIESSCRESSCRVEVQSRGIESRHRVEAQNRGIELSCRVEVQRAKLQSRGIESGYRVDVQSRGSSSPVPPLSTTIRMLWRLVSGPIRCAESACSIHLSIRALVVEVQAKSGPISQESEKFRQHLFFPCTTIFN